MLITIQSCPVDFRGLNAMIGAEKLQCVKRIWRRNEGSSAVEFALVLPLFLLLMFGAADFGFVVYTQSVMFNAAREAARRMAVDSTHTVAQAQSDAQEHSRSTGRLPLTQLIPSDPLPRAPTA